MPHPHLAPEIWDQILDHLWNDSAALKRCSRTCRSWVPASRYHLFYAMNLDEPSDTQRLQQFLDSHPDNFRYVRLLRLRLGSVMGDGVVSLIPRLKNVTTLECEFKTHLLNVTEATKQALSSLLSLKSVLLWGFYFGDYVAIIEILSALPESLTSVEASVFTPLPTVALDPSLPPSTKIDHVQELAIRSAPHGIVGGIVPWLMNATRIRPRRLVLECPQPRDQIALAKLLNDPCVAECIEDLTIDVRQRPERLPVLVQGMSASPASPGESSTVSSASPWTFVHLKRLRSLSLTIDLFDMIQPSTILSSIPSSDLREITFVVGTQSFKTMQSLTKRNACLDAALVSLSARFPFLSIYFRTYVPNASPHLWIKAFSANAMEMFASALPGLWGGSTPVWLVLFYEAGICRRPKVLHEHLMIKSVQKATVMRCAAIEACPAPVVPPLQSQLPVV